MSGILFLYLIILNLSFYGTIFLKMLEFLSAGAELNKCLILIKTLLVLLVNVTQIIEIINL